MGHAIAARVAADLGPCPPIQLNHPLPGDTMLKMTRWAALAATLLVAAPTVVPLALAQGQPATPAVTAPADTTAQAPAPAAKAGVSKEVVDNPYGLEALWKGGDIVARFTLGILAIMSMGSWYIIITKVYEQYRMGRHAKIGSAH